MRIKREELVQSGSEVRHRGKVLADDECRRHIDGGKREGA